MDVIKIITSNFTDTKWTNVSFSHCELTGKFDNAVFTGCAIHDCTITGTGLDDTVIRGNNTVSNCTITSSGKDRA